GFFDDAIAYRGLYLRGVEIYVYRPEDGGAGESRTRDTQFRKLLLYPSELQPPRDNSTLEIGAYAAAGTPPRSLAARDISEPSLRTGQIGLAVADLILTGNFDFD